MACFMALRSQFSRCGELRTTHVDAHLSTLRAGRRGGGVRSFMDRHCHAVWLPMMLHSRYPQSGILVKSYLVLSLLSASGLSGLYAADPLLDLAPYGVRSSVRANSRDAGIEWRDVRDIHEVRVRFTGNSPADLELQYWAHTWPGP